ncbi:MAG: membrane protein insertion efficiency factor YidD [Oceanospirillaceae bacterium]|nr:membrane protein insertion efficiency factor YidD [Oceanospirillaceae bacterium]MBT13847.1 membrane protein insertion efficiency factor YidD [Oceanospirillaceae bacterium]
MTEEQTAKAKNAASPGAKALLLLISVYRYAISPLLPSRCRYYPTCSSYAQEAVSRYGALRGGWLAIKRLLRCHPWGSHGVDPVPDLPEKHHSHSHCCQRKP